MNIEKLWVTLTERRISSRDPDVINKVHYTMLNVVRKLAHAVIIFIAV